MAILFTDFAESYAFSKAAFVTRKCADLGLSPATSYFAEELVGVGARVTYNLRPNADKVVSGVGSAGVAYDPVTDTIPGDAADAVAQAATSNRQNSVEPPATNVNGAAGAAGALTGTYYYTSVFVLDDGTKTEPWPGTASAVVLTAQRANLSTIPVSSSARVVARELYRTIANPVDPKDYLYHSTIADNTTTTAVDNLADGSLGAPINWAGTQRGKITLGGLNVGVVNGQATLYGTGTLTAGYACVGVGFEALKAITSGRRSTAVGVYALTSMTTGYENAGFGTHAGQNLTTARQGTFLGAYAGYNVTTHEGNTFAGYNAGSNAGLGAGSARWNVGVGIQACKGASDVGVSDYNVGLGYLALGEMRGVGACIGLGPWAGRYADNNRQVFIDTNDRTNIATAQASGLIYGKGETTAKTQVLHLNAATRVGWGAAVVADLPAAAAGLKGFRAWVGDASVAYTSANVGSTVAGGGANAVPVFCNGTAWVIG